MHPFLKKISSYDKNSIALVYENKHYSYQVLLESVSSQLNLLSSLPQNSVLGLVGDYDMQSIATMLAAIERKLILVPLTHYENVTSKLEGGQVDFLYQKNSLKALNPSQNKHQILQDLKNSNQNGLILFSSGTTGKPKAIVHNLDILLDSYLNKKARSINILLFLTFDHIGGLNTLFSTLAIGSCGVAIKDRKNIETLAKNIQDHQISMLPASPSLLNLIILSEVFKRYNLSSLKIITYGTEQMPDLLLEKLKLVLPKVRFHQTFGTTEVGITQTKTLKNAIKLENILYKIIDNELYLKSPTQALGYLNVSNCIFDKQGYFATGDLVKILYESDGEYIKIIGRTKEIINVGGEKVLPQEIENIILQIQGVKDCLVYGEKNSITGQSITLEVVVDTNILNADKLELKKVIRSYCKDRLVNYKIPTKVIAVDSLIMSERFKKIRNIKTTGGGGVNRLLHYEYYKHYKFSWDALCKAS